MLKISMLVVILLSFSILAVVVIGEMGEKSKPAAPVVPDASCGECHSCVRPTTEAPCLRPCPRFSKIVAVHSPEEGPEVAILDQLEDLYVPVLFPHKFHAQMAEMGEGCVVCHHYSPPGPVPPCRECHGGPFNPENLRQPGLKGTYHRLCMKCHREWSHDTECTICHARKTAEAKPVQITDTTDIMGLLHPNIEEPDKRVYQTDYKGGTLVTFHHKEHIHLFGLKCVDCHQEESCIRCHTTEEKPKRVKTVEEHHKPCFSCHAKDGCAKCHSTKETPGFTHAQTGWPLGRYHQNLNCHACHPAGRKISKLNPDCNACHGNWTTGTFDHAVTGLVFDEIHQQMDCTDCHLERKLDQKPSCVACHDDERAYPENSPGTTIKKR